MENTGLSRRRFLAKAAGSIASGGVVRHAAIAAEPPSWRLDYVLASALYGYAPLEQILPEVKKTGAKHIDIWPKVHGNQREQIEAMGHDHFAELLAIHGVKLGGIACYTLGPFGLRDEMHFARRIAGPGVVLVCGARGPKGLAGAELKQAVGAFAEAMKPHAAVAEETGCLIAVENHANSLIESPDSIRWFGEMARSDWLGVALAPHHLRQDAGLIAGIAADLGPKVKFFYAQQHGKGSTQKLPKEDELLQMPGRGPLDFGTILAALRRSDYRGLTEIFMHPVPRGIPILEPPAAVTAEINRARRYLNDIARLHTRTKT